MSDTQQNPFPGPQPYTYGGSHKLPGRTNVAKQLLQHVLAYRCVILYGPSDAGKSSLMQAKVIPALEDDQDYRPVIVQNWPSHGEDESEPFKWLLNALYDQLGLLNQETVPQAPGESVRGRPSQESRSNDAVIGSIQRVLELAWLRSERPILIYLDQLEQLLVRGQDGQADQNGAQRQPAPSERERLHFQRADAVLACVNYLATMPTLQQTPAQVLAQTEAPSLPTIKLVLALREDYLGRFQERTRRYRQLTEHSFRLQPMSISEMVEAACEAAAARQWLQSRPALEDLLIRMQSAPGNGMVSSHSDVEAAYAQILWLHLWERQSQGSGFSPLDPILAKTDPSTVLERYLEDRLTSVATEAHSALTRTDPGRGQARNPDDRLGNVAAEAHSALLKVLEERFIDAADGSRSLLSEAQARNAFASTSGGTALLESLERVGVLRSTEHQGRRFFELGHDSLAARLRKQRAEREREHQQQEAILKEREEKEEALRKEREKQDMELAVERAKRAEQEAAIQEDRAKIAEQEAKLTTARAQEERLRTWVFFAVFASIVAGAFAIYFDNQSRKLKKETAGRRILNNLMREQWEPGARLNLLRLAMESVYDRPKNSSLLPAEHEELNNILLVATSNVVVSRPMAPEHTGVVRTVAFAPDGRRLVSGSEDGTAKVWDAQSGVLVFDLLKNQDNSGWVYAVAFSPKPASNVGAPSNRPTTPAAAEPTQAQQQIAVGGHDGVLRFFQPETGAELLPDGHEHTRSIYALAFSGDGQRVVTGSEDGTAVVWNAGTHRKEGVSLVHNASNSATSAASATSVAGSPIRAVAFSQDSKLIATAGEDGYVLLWDADTHAVRCRTAKVSGPVRSVAFSNTDDLLVTGNEDKTIRIWNSACATVGDPIILSSIVYSVAFNPQKPQQIVSAGADEFVRMWDLHKNDSPPGAATNSIKGNPSSCNCEPAGLFHYHLTQNAQFPAHDERIHSIAFSNDNHIVTGSADKTVRVIDLDKIPQLIESLYSHQGTIYNAHFFPESELSTNVKSKIAKVDRPDILTSSADKTACLWRRSTGGQVSCIPTQERSVWTAVFSPDGKHVVTGNNKGELQIWDRSSEGQIVSTAGQVSSPASLIRHTRQINSAMFSADGKWILTASNDGTIGLSEWQGTHAPTPVKLGKPVERAVFGRKECDRMILTVSEDRKARIYDWVSVNRSPELRTEILHDKPLFSGDISPDCRFIATGGADQVVRVWDIKSPGAPVNVLQLIGHKGTVYSVNYAPNGNWLVTASGDKTARIWDVKTPAPLPKIAPSVGPNLTIQGHGARLWYAEFSPDSRFVVTAGDDQIVRVIPVTLDGMFSFGCRVLISNPQTQQADFRMPIDKLCAGYIEQDHSK